MRQVDDIKRMVDEFSKFARMPKAVIAAEDVADTVRQVVFLHARRQRRYRHRVWSWPRTRCRRGSTAG